MVVFGIWFVYIGYSVSLWSCGPVPFFFSRLSWIDICYCTKLDSAHIAWTWSLDINMLNAVWSIQVPCRNYHDSTCIVKSMWSMPPRLRCRDDRNNFSGYGDFWRHHISFMNYCVYWKPRDRRLYSVLGVLLWLGFQRWSYSSSFSWTYILDKWETTSLHFLRYGHLFWKDSLKQQPISDDRESELGKILNFL